MAVYYADQSAARRYVDCEFKDPSFIDGEAPFVSSCKLACQDMEKLFFEPYQLQFVFQHLVQMMIPFRIVTLPKPSNTCLEKASLLGNWNPLSVIKAIYLQVADTDDVIAVIVPETGYSLNKEKVRSELSLSESVVIKKSQWLPDYMEYGTCSPFVRPLDLYRGDGKLRYIIFDDTSLKAKAREDTFDDFSIGLNHCVSIQLNYFDCFNAIRDLLGSDVVVSLPVMDLVFKEKLIRKKGRLRIDYDFQSLDFNTANFLNNSHGNQELNVIKTHVNQMDALPFDVNNY